MFFDVGAPTTVSRAAGMALKIVLANERAAINVAGGLCKVAYQAQAQS